VELLVVIAIIGILVALLLPAIQAARAAARRTQCQNNLKNLTLAALNFQATKGYFAPAGQDRAGEPPAGVKPKLATHNGITLLLPYFEQGNKFQLIDFDWDWDDARNSDNELHTKQDLGGILICPESPVIQENRDATDYIAANRVDTTKLKPLLDAGLIDDKHGLAANDPAWNGMLQRDYLVSSYYSGTQKRVTDRRRVYPRHMTDGLSHTWMYYESVAKPFMFGVYENSKGEVGVFNGEYAPSTNSKFRWASPATWMTINDFCGESQLINCNNVSRPFGFHPGGIFISSADGSVDFYDEQIDPNVFVAHVTMAGGEP
jgi:type II secretory pathway pseudopilin PulG